MTHFGLPFKVGVGFGVVGGGGAIGATGAQGKEKAIAQTLHRSARHLAFSSTAVLV